MCLKSIDSMTDSTKLSHQVIQFDGIRIELVNP